MSALSVRQIGSCRIIEQSSYESCLALATLVMQKNTAVWRAKLQHASTVQRSAINYFCGAAYNLIGAVRTIITESESIWLSSTMKKRRMKMNKHKLKKRMKDMRANTKVSRG